MADNDPQLAADAPIKAYTGGHSTPDHVIAAELTRIRFEMTAIRKLLKARQESIDDGEF
jgi:hypothetical protein